MDRRTFITTTTAATGLTGLVSGRVIAQERPPVDWDYTFGEQGNDRFMHGISTSDGGYLFVGSTERSGTEVGWVVKLDAQGTVVWDDHGDPDEGAGTAYTAVELGNNRYLVAGDIDTGEGFQPFYIVFENGEVQRRRISDRFGTLYSVIQTNDGKVAFAGSIMNDRNNSPNPFVAKGSIAESGPDWEWSSNRDGPAQINQLVPGTDGGVVGVGSSVVDGGRVSGIGKWEDGEQAWSTELPADSRDVTLWSLTQTYDGGYLAVGGAGTRGIVWKVNRVGEQAWVNRYDGDGELVFRDVLRIPDAADSRGFVLAGQQRASTGETNGWVQSISTSGESSGGGPWGGDLNDEFTTVVLGPEEPIFGGTTASNGSGGTDAWVIRPGSTGGSRGPVASTDPFGEGRGFFTNSGNPALGPLADPVVLTVGGFVLSVLGILHQLLRGR